MKTLLATSILLASTSAFAHNASFSTDSCNVEIEGGISITNDSLTFSKDKKSLYKIENNELFVSDKKVQLTDSQRSLLTQYSTSIRAVVPEVKGVALDAMDLAVDGVNLAFNELLGEGNSVGRELTTELGKLRSEIQFKFDENKTISFDEDGFDGEEFFGEEFEQRIESLVETTITNSMGSLLIAVGQELLFSGGDPDAFEARMEKFGEQIEYEMESRGEQIEKRGEALCGSIANIDNIEELLKSSIDELSDTNFLTVKDKRSI
ncbi:DUF2884 family protein [Thalassotalea profundi]|uniref:DUF2884 family protein n=1 Tax=Thalassotalea profundi TaxID=2036687 RepID=A0ABQ3IMY3_9GAMM|nr:DUF2884 family protein [Thalassotalea profundi]GHE86862.1 hypothetical protein GCM10011501_15130 [Thalassotalea profundi]